ncbi:hypothetical protein PYW07_012378 [Mythimna separata]|uniref:Regulatory protein zeste n=1 Tax=Mythimna separata TaxID=271217 RepID=A0AAD7YM44_MYTSE|nr:hypothetical protein PYW07_012378 [Mythimna separata]
MSRVSQAQMKKLLDLLSEDGVLVDGKVVYTNTNKTNFWRRIAVQLNGVDGGVYKNTWKWCKMWADWKNKTKKKANILLSRKTYSDAQSPTKLTNLELRLLKMINYPIDDKEDALTLEMIVSKEELPETTDEFQVEFLNRDYGDGDMQSQEQTVSDVEEEEEEHKSIDCFNKVESKFCDVDDILQDDNLEEEEPDEELSDYEKKIKSRGKTTFDSVWVPTLQFSKSSTICFQQEINSPYLKFAEQLFKKRKVSLEEYKVRTTLKIEKERVQQKTEELRLRALELKLKGEELRLKEIEMNKINYLTSIEEEKLKCFKEISSSLKELSERTRSGAIRYQSII